MSSSNSSNLAKNECTAAAAKRSNGVNSNGFFTREENESPSINGHAAKVSNIVALAQIISKETEKLDYFLKETETPYPSFDFDGPADFPKLPNHIQNTRQEIIRATSELRDLIVGPTESLRWMAWDVSFFFWTRSSHMTYFSMRA